MNQVTQKLLLLLISGLILLLSIKYTFYFILALLIIIIIASIVFYKFWINPGSHVKPIFTKWGENLDKDNILQEYPRPQFQRESYLNLNGYWDYAIIKDGEKLDKYQGKILVPFALETPINNINKTLKEDMTLIYNKKIDLSNFKNNGRFILHFGAVDQEAKVYINKNYIGCHKGGYTSFEFDITESIKEDLTKVIGM